LHAGRKPTSSNVVLVDRIHQGTDAQQGEHVMSHHINFRTTSQVRSAPGSGVASKVGVPTPDRPRRGRAGRFAVAAGAALVVGAGVLIADSVVEPDAPSSLSNDDPGRSQQQAVGSSSQAARPSTSTSPARTGAAGARRWRRRDDMGAVIRISWDGGRDGVVRCR
jgi:hypothetical protein